MLTLPDLALYVHIPWCVRKCPYCDFNSHESKNGIDEQRYIDALLSDLSAEAASVEHRPIETIFIGGGTPSLFSPETIDKLLCGVGERMEISAVAEITLEANPGTAESENFLAYRQSGINRLSIGMQSLNDRHLKLIGRIHDATEALNAYQIARNAGFGNINLDLMFGLPEQSSEEALADLDSAIMLRPEHLSWYQLTLEPNTGFHHHPPANMPNDDLLVEIMEAGQQRLVSSGYLQYEVSAWSPADRNCRHNLNYWRFGDYLGIGAGAHGKITAADGVIRRRRKQRHPENYMEAAREGNAVSSETILQDEDLLLEFMMNALRLNQGVDASLFEERTGLRLDAIEQRLRLARDSGLLEADEQRILPTSLGRRYLNDLLLQFS